MFGQAGHTVFSVWYVCWYVMAGTCLLVCKGTTMMKNRYLWLQQLLWLVCNGGTTNNKKLIIEVTNTMFTVMKTRNQSDNN